MDEEATARVMADVEEEMRSWTKEEPRRRVVDGKRMMKKPMAVDKVRRVLAMNPKPVVILSLPESDVTPVSLASLKFFQFGVGMIREFQDNVRRDLDAKGYVLGWATDDEEDE